MSAVNEATGLPDLPEGQWWEVRRVEEYFNPAIFEVVIATRGEQLIHAESESRRAWWNLWLAPDVTVTKSTPPGPITLARGSIYEEPDLEGLEPGQFPGIRAARRITPELIRATAARVLESHEEALRTEALLGSYPPKKLEADQ